MQIQFVWDDEKALYNAKKHGITFEEALTTFSDQSAAEFFDNDHSEIEDRFLLLGISSKLRLLLVSYCFRKKGNVIRIISARKATKSESKYYPYKGLK